MSRTGSRRFEGYPTVIPVELVQLKPVAFKAPEIKHIQPRTQTFKPELKKVEGITLEKKKPTKEEPVEEPVKTEPKIKSEEEIKEEQSVTGDEGVRLDVKEFPFTYYLSLLRARIQTNWEPPVQSSRAAISNKAIIYFKIQRSGRITNMAIENGSGDYLFDQAALRAVTLANPLPPLPYDFPEKSLGVHFEFEQGN